MNNSGLPDKLDPNGQTLPQQPIILPAPLEQQPYIQPQQQSPSGRWMPPDQGNRPLPPTNLGAGSNRSWKNDPAYRVLFIAIGVVILSSLACVAVLAATFNHSSSQTGQTGGPNTQRTTIAGGVNITVSTPTATPIPTPTPTLVPTPVPTPTSAPTPVIANLAISVTDPVQNFTTVPVTITGSKPGAQITLVITYTNATSFNNTTLIQNADDAGNATFSWQIQIATFRKTVTAQLQVTAQDGQGNQTSTQTTVTVKAS